MSNNGRYVHDIGLAIGVLVAAAWTIGITATGDTVLPASGIEMCTIHG
jgi:hypothetical protein